MAYRSGSYTTFHHRIHLVWAPKYQYKVLHGEVGLRVREIIKLFCDEMGVTIVNGALSRDHVHMFVEIPPHVSASVRTCRPIVYPRFPSRSADALITTHTITFVAGGQCAPNRVSEDGRITTCARFIQLGQLVNLRPLPARQRHPPSSDWHRCSDWASLYSLHRRPTRCQWRSRLLRQPGIHRSGG